MLFYFFIGNTLFYLSLEWFPSFTILTSVISAVMNFTIGVMVTYNALVANNKRTIENMLKPKE